MEHFPWCLFISLLGKLFRSQRKRQGACGHTMTKQTSVKRLRFGSFEKLHIEVNEYTPSDKD